MSSQLKSALWHAAHGVHVFPLQVGDKRPLKGSHGELDGTLDEDQIRRWWHRVPWNIGAALRYTPYFALDIDVRSGGDELLATIESDSGKLPDTVTVISASGWPGRHYWFRKTPELKTCRVRGLGIGIDVKGLGHGYTLVPPSETPKGIYSYEISSYLGQLPVAEPPAWLVKRLLALGRAHCGSSVHSDAVSARSFLLGCYFEVAGELGKQLKPGVFSVLCPNRSAHSCGKDFDGSTVIYAPNVLGFTRISEPIGALLCLHSHCGDLTDEFLDKFTKAAG